MVTGVPTESTEQRTFGMCDTTLSQLQIRGAEVKPSRLFARHVRATLHTVQCRAEYTARSGRVTAYLRPSRQPRRYRERCPARGADTRECLGRTRHVAQLNAHLTEQALVRVDRGCGRDQQPSRLARFDKTMLCEQGRRQHGVGLAVARHTQYKR